MKAIYYSLGCLITLFLIVESADAQMINYERRKKRQEKVINLRAQTGPTTPTQTQTQNQATRHQSVRDEIARVMQSQPKVANRTERLYDSNRDGLLQEDEIKNFYSDVVSATERRGQFRISSELLRGFDSDEDGRISRLEASNIRTRIE